MRTRTKTWLAYPALIVVVLAVINFGVLVNHQSPPVPVFITHPLGIAASAYRFPFQLSGRFGQLSPRRALPPAGPLIATGRAGGRIGRVRFGSRSLNVAV